MRVRGGARGNQWPDPSRVLAGVLAFLAFLALGVGPSATAGAQGGPRLTQDQLLELFPGTYSGFTRKGTEFRFHGESGGALRGISGWLHDSGRWWVEGNRLCIQFSYWMRAKKRCAYVTRDGEWFVAVKSNGKVRMRFKP